VTQSSFADLKLWFEAARAFLRAFTLGRRGSGRCDRLKERFTSGPQAEDATAGVAAGRKRLAAACVRLALLRGKHRAEEEDR
jgi:hypothetical protein